jgi:hypothetical protein
MTKEKLDIEWAVYILLEKAKYIGCVHAPDAQSAKLDQAQPSPP